jgi:hypothetical protein
MKKNIPRSLRTFFVIHFILDFAFAIPLFFFPTEMMQLFGFPETATLFPRMIASALFAIGGVSLLMNSKGTESYLAMLKLKIIWSFTAIISIALTLFAILNVFLISFFLIFLAFFFIWTYFYFELKKAE